MQAETPVARVLLDPEAGRPANLPASIPGLVWAFRTLPDGSAEPLAIDQPIALTQNGSALAALQPRRCTGAAMAGILRAGRAGCRASVAGLQR
jgi:hypothetical protein